MNRPSRTRTVHVADGIELIRGDCLKVMAKRQIAADHVITDPPYEEEMHKAKRSYGNIRRMRTDGYATPRPVTFESIGKTRAAIMPLIKAGCAGWFVAFCTPEGIAAWRDEIEAAGIRYKRACFWDKIDAAPQFNGQGPGYAVEPFVTAWCGPGMSSWNGGGMRNLFSHATNNSDRRNRRRSAKAEKDMHETEKPVSLMADIISKFTNPGDLILDPFMGTGATGVAAAKLGRRFMGIEKDPDYFRVAVSRIRMTVSQTDFFVSIPAPKQIRMEL